MIALGFLNQGYGLYNFCSSIGIEPTKKRVTLQPALMDSTSFLGDFVLPGIPVLAQERPGREKPLLYFDQFLQQEYKWNIFRQPCLQEWMFSKRSATQGLHVLNRAFENSLALLLKHVDGQIMIRNRFPTNRYRDNLLPLDIDIIYDSRGQVTMFVYEGHGVHVNHNCNDKKIQQLVQIALCSCLTQLTFKWHLLSTHLLCAQTIYSLAMTKLPKNDPYQVLIAAHGAEVTSVDLKKGASLVKNDMAKDWSFDEQGVKDLFHSWQSTFNINDYGFNSLLPTRGAFYLKALQTWKAIEKYVFSWIQLLPPPSSDFMQELIHRKLLQGTEKKQLATFLCNYIYMSIFVHEHVGDQATDIIEHSYLFVPKTPNSEQTLMSLERFRLVYLEATKESYHLNRPEWIERLPVSYRSIAKKFQEKMNEIDPEYKLGVNS